jgi:acetyl-CoA decarbonylase/synthase complex subunit alpha
MDSREILNYAIKRFGRDKEAHQGGERCYIGDWANSIGLYTGIWANTLGRVEVALSYAEAQLTKLFLASYQGNGSVEEFETMTFHTGYAQAVAQDAAELVKTSCFDFIAAPGQPAEIMNNWPPPTVQGGFGSVEPGKPVIAVMGDSFLPAWSAVDYLKENGLTEQIEVCGIGSAGDDVARFYDRCRIVSPMMRAAKAIRSGIADVIIASNACVPIDVVAEAKRVESRVIWTGHQGTGGLPDRTDDPIDEIVNDLVEGANGAWIRNIEKAGEVAVKVVQKVKRKGDYLLSEEAVKKEAGKCLEGCDLCFSACPNNLLLSRAVRAAQQEGIMALAEVEKGCYLCGKCEEVCPANIPLCDLMVAAQGRRAPEEKFVMRPGRGAIPVSELLQDTFSILYGNQPGAFMSGR